MTTRRYVVTIHDSANMTDEAWKVHTILTSRDFIAPRERVEVEALGDESDAVAYHVEDNVTGARASKDFPSLEAVGRLCGSLNLTASGAGGRYGVYDDQGNRA